MNHANTGRASDFFNSLLAVDETNVMIMEYAYNIAISVSGEGWHALNVQWEVVVTDRLLV